MNFKRFILSAIVLFVFMFLFEWVMHGMLLSGLYEQTPQVWRPKTEMSATMPAYIIILLVLAFWLAFVFTRLFKEGGVASGLLFGIYFGIFCGLVMGMWYLWLPVTPQVGLGWFATGLIESVLGGCILGSIYHSKNRSKKKG